MSERKTNIEKIIEKIRDYLERIRNVLADLSRIIIWFGNYFAFVIVIFLVIGSIAGILNATWELTKLISLIFGREYIIFGIEYATNQTTHQTPDSGLLYPKLIKIAEYYLISFTLFLIAIGIHRIISKVISKEITKIEHLESLMIGLVVITMSVIFLETIFGVATNVIGGVESVLMFGLAMAVVIVGLALYLKFREKRAEFEVPIDKVTDKAFTEKEKEEIYKKLKEELKKAIEERREDDVEKIVRLIDSIKKLEK